MQLNRKQFLKLSSFSAFAWLLNASGIRNNKEEHTDRLKNNTMHVDTFNSSPVIFLSEKDSAYMGWNIYFNKRIQKHPKLIALWKNTEGVAEAIKYAKKHDMAVAVKSALRPSTSHLF